MKRTNLLVLLLILAVLTAGCSGEEPQLCTDGELCYPGLAWGMTAEEAAAALDLREGDYTDRIKWDNRTQEDLHASIYMEYEMTIPERTLFLPAREVRLTFRSYTREAEPMLSLVQVVYAPETDADMLVGAVAAKLGPSTTDAYTGESIWAGEHRTADYMSDGYYLETAADYVDYGHLGILGFSASELRFVTDIHDDHALEYYGMEAGETALIFSTSLTEVFQHDPDCTRKPITARTAFEGSGLLVCPGTMWSMTAEQVADALSLPDAVPENGELKADLAFAGFDAEVTFEFDTWIEGLEPGLTAVEIAFPEKPEGLPELLDDTLGPSPGGIWTGSRTVAEFLETAKFDWYQELSQTDPEIQSASTLSWSGSALRFESPLTMAAQLNQSEEPEPEDPFAELKELFDRDEWYRCALTSFYDSPGEVDLGELFYECTMDGKVTGAERETLLAVYSPEMIESCANVRVTQSEMQEVLNHYFGLDLADCDLSTMQQWHYCAETDAWLTLAATPNAFDPEFEGGTVLENGDTLLFYRWERNKSLRAVVLRNVDGIWQIRSNQLVKE